MLAKVCRRWRSMSRSLLWRMAFVGIVLLLAGLVGRLTVILPHLRDEVADIVAQQQTTLANFVAQDINGKLQLRLDTLAELAHSLPPAIVGHPADLPRWLARNHGAHTALFHHIRLVPLDADDGWWTLQPSAVRSGLGAGQRVIGKPIAGQASGQAEIPFAVPVRDAQGQVVAALTAAAAVGQAGFMDGLLHKKNEQTGDFLLIAPQHQLYVAAANPDMVLRPTPAPGLNPLHDRAMQGFRGVAIGTSVQGQKNIAAIVDVPVAGWFLSARVPYQVVEKPIDQIGTLFMQASGAQVLVLLSVVILVFGRMFRPLLQAAAQLRQMARGHEPLRPLPVVYQDEVGELAGGFNHLLEQLEINLSNLRESEARMAKLARHDPLTNLPNRSVLNDRLEHASDQADRLDAQVSLLFLDLDGFKAINDRFGHKAGDGVLLEVATRLKASRRKSDLVVRLGGDEFVIVLQNKGPSALAAQKVAQQCIDAIGQPFHVGDSTVELGVSIGIAHQPPGQTTEFLLIQADAAMYAAKSAGRNRYCEFEPSMRVPDTKNTNAAHNP